MNRALLPLIILFVFILSAQAAPTAQERFNNSWNFYQKQVQQGVSDEERIITLDRIIRKYENLPVDLAEVYLERESLEKPPLPPPPPPQILPAPPPQPTLDPEPEAEPVQEASSSMPVYLGKRHEIYSLVGYKTGNDEWESGGYGELGYLYTVNPLVSVGVAAGYVKVDNKVRMLSKGDITMVPLLAKVRVSAGERHALYLEGGLGIYILDHEVDPSVVQALQALGFDFEEDLKNAGGSFLGAGYKFSITDHVAFGLNVAYHIIRPDVEVTLRDRIFGTTASTIEEVDLNSVIGGAVISVLF